MNSNLQCYPQDKTNTGQFTSSGARSTSGSTYYISGKTYINEAFTPPPMQLKTNGAAVAATGGGAAVVGAAVIGLAFFNKKNKMKQAPGIELSDAAVV